MAAIELGEAAVDPADIARSGPRVREDPLRPRELDAHAFSRIQPIIDKKVRRLKGEGFDDDDKAIGGLKALGGMPTASSIFKGIGEVVLDPGENPADRAQIVDGARRAARGEAKDWEGMEGRNLSGEMWNQALKDMSKVKTSGRLEQAFDDPDKSGQELDMNELEKDNLSNPPPSYPPEALHSKESTRERLKRVIAAGVDTDPPSVAPELPRINDPNVRWDSLEQEKQEFSRRATEDETNKPEEIKTSTATDVMSKLPYHRLSQQTGMPSEELERLRTTILSTHRVVSQTRMGKIQSLYYLAVAGNEAGLIGLGEASSENSESGRRIAFCNAIRAMQPILRYERRTIFGEVRGKCSAAEVTLSARPPGYGLRCSHTIFEMARCAGLTDLSARLHRSRNVMNVAKAAWEALCEQRDPEEVARARGRKMVDVRKVYYAGLV